MGKKSTGSSTQGDTQLSYRFYATMAPRRIYPLEVEVTNTKQSSSAGTVVVRPVIPGAHVVPSEQRLDGSRAGNKVTFHVTPLASGRLKSAHLDVFAPGRAAQSVPLSMRAATQRCAWLLLLCAVAIPSFLWAITRGPWRVEEGIEYKRESVQLPAAPQAGGLRPPPFGGAPGGGRPGAARPGGGGAPGGAIPNRPRRPAGGNNLQGNAAPDRNDATFSVSTTTFQDAAAQPGGQNQPGRANPGGAGRPGGGQGNRPRFNLDDFFSQRDKDKDGKLSEDEYLASEKERFAKIDADKDKSVTVAELEKGPQPPRRGRRQFNAAEFLKDNDEDKDGKLSENEFLASTRARFTQMDADKDKAVTKEEVQAAFARRQGGGGRPGGGGQPGGGQPGGGRPGGGQPGGQAPEVEEPMGADGAPDRQWIKVEKKIPPHEMVRRGVTEWFTTTFDTYEMQGKDRMVTEQRPIITTGWEKAPGAMKRFTLQSTVADGAAFGYEKLLIGVNDYGLVTILAVVFLLLTFIASSAQRPHRVRRKGTVTLAPAEARSASKQQAEILLPL